MELSELMATLEAMANVPFITVVGSTRDRLICYSNEGGAYTVWSVNADTGQRFRVTPGPVAQIAEPRHSSNSVVYTKDTAKGGELHQVFSADAIEGKEALTVDPPPMRIEGLAADGELVAFTGTTKEEMALYTSESGRLEKRLSVPPSATLTDVSSQYAVGVGSLAKNPRSMELFILDLSRGKFSVYTPKEGSVNKFPRLGGSRILFESDHTGKNRLFIYEIESGQLGPASYAYTDHVRYEATEHPNFGWTDDGKVWFVGKKNGEAKAFVDGRGLESPPGYLWGMTSLRGTSYVSHNTVVQPTRVIEASTEAGKCRVVVDNPLPARLAGKLGNVRFVRFESFDGRSVSALVVDHGGPRRTVVLVHGGPWGEYENTWGPIIGSIAASGYNVIAPNFRGSTGYGEDFRILDIGDPGGGDLKDVVLASKWALQNNLATEVAIMGYSYGGYMTLLAMGKEPEKWACGVAGAPVTDWKEMHELSDALYREFIEELFDKKMELLSERSPITYVKNVRRPVCIITSQNDSRTPIKPVLKYVAELANQGARFELHSVPDMGHAVTTSRGIIDILYPGISFLQKQFPV